MNGQAALVTGAGKRLGRAMALRLAERGFAVVVHYNSAEAEADAVVSDIISRGGKAVAVQADLLDEAACQGLIPRAVDAIGAPLSVLINNASIFDYDNLKTATRASWDRHMESNLRAPFVLTQHFAEQVPDAPTDENGEPVAAGLVINMIDQRVRKLTPEFMTYTLAKMGLWAFTQTAAMALAPKIRVNAIGPGPTLKGARQSEAHFSAQRRNTILQRGADEAEITAAMDYFLTAKSVTGQLICADGGQHLAWQTPDVLGVE